MLYRTGALTAPGVKIEVWHDQACRAETQAVWTERKHGPSTHASVPCGPCRGVPPTDGAGPVRRGPAPARFGGGPDHMAGHAPYDSIVEHFDAADRPNADKTACAVRSSTPDTWDADVAGSAGVGGFFRRFERDGRPLGTGNIQDAVCGLAGRFIHGNAETVRTKVGKRAVAGVVHDRRYAYGFAGRARLLYDLDQFLQFSPRLWGLFLVRIPDAKNRRRPQRCPEYRLYLLFVDHSDPD